MLGRGCECKKNIASLNKDVSAVVTCRESVWVFKKLANNGNT